MVYVSMIALRETAINSTHAIYNIPNYNVKMNYIERKRGSGVSLYIQSTAQYKTRNDIEMDGNTNSIFILKHHLILSVMLFVGVFADPLSCL